MNCFQCCGSEEKVNKKSLKKSIKEFEETKTLTSFANISFKSGRFCPFAPSYFDLLHWLHMTCLGAMIHVGFQWLIGIQNTFLGLNLPYTNVVFEH